MPLKKSKRLQKQTALSKAVQSFSETDTREFVSRFVKKLGPQDWIFLDGPLGVGKTSFAKMLLEALNFKLPSHGSPSFPIVHDYGKLVHIDFYRLKSMQEIEEAGILHYFSERDCLIVTEWLSAWPKLESELIRSARGSVWKVKMSFFPKGREISVSKLL